MFYSGQKMVENFFKRTRLRRSKRLRNSFRSSIIGRSKESSINQKEEARGLTPPTTDEGAVLTEHQSQVEKQPSMRKSQRWKQSFSRRSRRSIVQEEIVITHEGDTQMPITSSNSTKLRPKTADARRLDMESGNSVELLAYKSNTSPPKISLPCDRDYDHELDINNPRQEDRERSSTDSKMVELLKVEVTNLRKQLKKQEETVASMHAREEALQLRLSDQARRQLERGSTKFEDLKLGANRPTQLIEKYGNLYSEGRVDALDSLDELPEIGECEDLKNKLLLSIIVLSFRSAQKSLLDLRAKLREVLHIPRVLQSGQPQLCHAARDLEDEVGLYLRKTIEKHDLSKNYNEVSKKVWSTLFDYPSLRECKGLKKYIAECVSTSWALTIQNPPMVINYEPDDFDEERHTRFHTSDSNSTGIKSFLWPTLTEGEKGVCVSKGIVIT